MKTFRFIILLMACSFTLAIFLAYGQVGKFAKPPRSTATHNEPGGKTNSPKYDADNYPVTKDENVRLREMIEYQKSLIIPVIDELLQHPIKCEAVVDDPINFAIYQELMSNRKGFSLTEFCIENGCDARQNLYSCLSVELEKNIQEDLKDDICTAYPNPCTIKAFLKVWKENPCSEAAAIALIKAKSPLYSALRYRDDDGATIKRNPYLNEINAIDDYLIANYPGTWQAQSAMCAKTIMNNAIESGAAITAQEAWIKRIERDKLLTNKYFVASFSSTPRDFVSGEYGRLADMYSKRLKAQSNQDKRNMAEELQTCLKYYDLLVNVHDKYGNDKNLVKEFQRFHGSPYCVDLVRENAPEHAKEQPLKDYAGR